MEHVRLGYAATEYGTQSTDTHDMSDARHVLEGIVASDRADIPAVVQRRQLAQQDRQPPRPQPRCQIPDWFHDLRADSANNYRQARQALDNSNAIREQFVQIVDTAAQRITQANTICAPFDDELKAASDAVKQAVAAQRAAQQRLDRSGLRHRRQARSELAAANETMPTTSFRYGTEVARQPISGALLESCTPSELRSLHSRATIADEKAPNGPGTRALGQVDGVELPLVAR